MVGRRRWFSSSYPRHDDGHRAHAHYQSHLTRERAEFSFKEIIPGKEYEITVKPTDTKEVMLGALKIETDSKIPKYQRQLSFFSVYRRPAAEPAPEVKP